MLEVVVGMIFTFMLLSLLGTTVNELISAWRGWRGFYLEEGLKRLLEFKDNPAVYEKFKDNPIFNQLMQHKAPLRVSQSPAYLSSDKFASILTNVLKKKGQAVEKVDDLLEGLPEDSQLRKVLEQLKEDGSENLDAYKARLQTWFDDVMTQAGGWYKRHVQFITLFVGLSIAGVLNADGFQIYKHLSNNAAARERLAAMAEQYAAENETLPATPTFADSLSAQDIKKEFKEATSTGDFGEVSNILGLGWHPGDVAVSPKSWLVRLLGWLITAFAISLGASFWFDILKKIVSIRNA